MIALRVDHGKLSLQAMMPGGRAEERAIHLELSACAVGNEWFRGKQVEAMIKKNVRQYGPASVDSAPEGSVMVATKLSKDVIRRVQEFADDHRIIQGNRSLAMRFLIERGLEAVTRGEREVTAPTTKRGD
jgi:hypothetical protein